MTDEQFYEAYLIALEIVNKNKHNTDIDWVWGVTTPSMSVLSGIVKDINDIYKSGIHIETGEYFATVYGALVLKEASCAGVSRAVGLCMSILDIPYEHINEDKWLHQYIRVVVWSGVYGEYIRLDAQSMIGGSDGFVE